MNIAATLGLLLGLFTASTSHAASLADLAQAAPPSQEQAAAASIWIGKRLTGAAAEPPPAIAADAAPRGVILSVSNGQGPAVVVLGCGQGLPAAAEQALRAAAELFPDPALRVWVKVDLIDHVEPVPARATPEADPYQWGLAFGGDIVLLPEELGLRRLMQRGRLDEKAAAAYLAGRSPRPGSVPELTPRLRFATISHFIDDAQAVPLVRGHRTSPSLTPQQLRRSLDASGRYMIDAVGADGSFAYSYDAGADTLADDYNVLRHAGTIWAMVELYDQTREQPLLAAAARACDNLVSRTKPALVYGEKPGEAPTPGEGLVVVENDEVKLGGNALAAFALARYITLSGEDRHLPVVQGLCRSLLAVQSTSGRFVVQQIQYSTGKRYSMDSIYYPGQAILALLALHKIDHDPDWLDAARRAADYLITVQRAFSVEKLEHDHWLIYALGALHEQVPDPRYVTHTLWLAAEFARTQHDRTGVPRSDLAGSWNDGRSAPAATRVEGLLAAVRLLESVHRDDDARLLLASAERGVQFGLQTQIAPEQAMYMPDPRRALGGFRGDLTGTEVRIDYVQHNVSAMLDLLREMDAQPATTAPRTP
jgi:hypothetical protein